MAPITKGLLMLTTRRINRTVSGNPAPLATLLVGLALLPLSIGSAAPPDIKAQATHGVSVICAEKPDSGAVDQINL